MPNDQAIEIHVADLNSLSLRLQRLHSELPVGERAVFEELLRGHVDPSDARLAGSISPPSASNPR